MRILVLTIAAATILAGCERKTDETTTPANEAETTSATADQQEPSDEPERPPKQSWTAVENSKLDDGQKGQMKKARAAQKDLGKTLIGALSRSVSERGFAESIEFCRGAAPDVTEKTAEKHGVNIGRTSHRLRNPKNEAPQWAAEAIETHVTQEGVAEPLKEPATYRGPDGQLGVLSPIPTADLCVNCHGPSDELAEGVGDALAKEYPDDRATGFESGDIRGWFWVEVPPS